MLKTLLGDSVQFLRVHWTRIGYLILPIAVPFEILSSAYDYQFEHDQFLDFSIQMAASIIVYAFYLGSVSFYVASVLSGEVLDRVVAWGLVRKSFIMLVILYLAIFVMTTIGFLILIVPGLYCIARFSFAPFYLLFDQLSIKESFEASISATQGKALLLISGYSLIYACLYIPYYFIELALPDNYYVYLGMDTIIRIGFVLPETLFTIFTFRVYTEVREQSIRPENTT